MGLSVCDMTKRKEVYALWICGSSMRFGKLISDVLKGRIGWSKETVPSAHLSRWTEVRVYGMWS